MAERKLMTGSAAFKEICENLSTSDDSDHESEKSECLTRASHADVGEVS